MKQSIGLMTRNWKQALAVSVGPIVIGVVAVFALMYASGLDIGTLAQLSRGNADAAAVPALASLALLAALAVVVAISAWIAVAWHRFILREEYPGLLPSVQGKLLGSYVLRTMVMSLVLVLVIFVANLFVGLIMAGLATFLPGLLVGSLGGFVLGLIFTWVWLRIGLVLPAAAVGQKMSMLESWRITKPLAEQVLVISAMFMAINIALELVLSLFAGFAIFSLVISLCTAWFMMMLGLCLPTTLYGVMIEGRELPRD
ncbi:hypothetical protein [Ketogulonicigenium robustum]|nr:hypothetical protein [Ketogulonicigenium robustum]